MNRTSGSWGHDGSNAYSDQTADSTVPGAVPFDLRFPGQLYDAESGLHYNYFRDYEPGVGRYVESDPIGLEGGINSFLYVEGEPLNWKDALGLARMYNPYKKCVGAATKKCGKTFERICSTFGGYEGEELEKVVAKCKSSAGPICKFLPNRDIPRRDSRPYNKKLGEVKGRCKKECPSNMTCDEWLDCALQVSESEPTAQ